MFWNISDFAVHGEYHFEKEQKKILYSHEKWILCELVEAMAFGGEVLWDAIKVPKLKVIEVRGECRLIR